MKIIETSIHCSRKEHELIKLEAHKKGLTISNFINQSLRKHLPLSEVPEFDHTINRNNNRLGARIPEDLHIRLTANVFSLTSDYRAVRMYHVVLTAVLMECEG